MISRLWLEKADALNTVRSLNTMHGKYRMLWALRQAFSVVLQIDLACLQEHHPIILQASTLHLQVAFDDLPFNINKSSSQRREYWDRSRRLQHGTLMALWWGTPATDTGSPDSNQPATEPCITFAVISVRDPDQLAPKGETEQRPSIGIR